MNGEWRMIEIEGRQYREKTVVMQTASGGTATVNICRPILTDAERAVREAGILDALQKFGRAMAERDEKRKEQTA